MRVYHERLWVPASWWVLGMSMLAILGGELIAGFGWLALAVVYLALLGGYASMLLSWGRARIEVADGELRAGKFRVPLSCVGEVTALDREQTRALRGPRADPSAFVLVRPYLHQAVYVQVHDAAGDVPYWLLCTRQPDDLAAALTRARAQSRAEGPVVG